MWIVLKKAISTFGQKCMAKNNPVKIWIIRHSPRRDPIFHNKLIFEGDGRSISDLLTIEIKGW